MFLGNMDFFAGLSAFVEGAKDQLDNLFQTLTEEDSGDVKRVNSKPHSRLPSIQTESNASRQVLGTDVPELSELCQDTYLFVSNLISDMKKAKKVFQSYYTLLKENSPEKLQNFGMTTDQVNHAKKMIVLLPALDKLRFELCPSIIPDKAFWCIYFSLNQDKTRLGSPKDILEEVTARQCNYYGERLEEPQRELNTGAPISTENGQSKNENSHDSAQLGAKRERDNAASEAELSEDINIVSDFLFRGAKKTLRFAEQFIETVDEQASSLSISRPTMSPKPAELKRESGSVSDKLGRLGASVGTSDLPTVGNGKDVDESIANEQKRAKYSMPRRLNLSDHTDVQRWTSKTQKPVNANDNKDMEWLFISSNNKKEPVVTEKGLHYSSSDESDGEYSDFGFQVI